MNISINRWGTSLLVVGSCLLLVSCVMQQPMPRPIIPTTTVVPPTAVSTDYISGATNTVEDIQTTQVAFPTLAMDVQTQLYELLSSNGNCELPCFLGIVPGETLWSDAKPFLEMFTNSPIRTDSTASADGFDVYYAHIQTTKEVTLILLIRLEVDANGRIQHILIKTDTRDSTGSLLTTDQHLSRYSLFETFKNNNLPSKVVMTPIKQGIYSLHVIYENMKMVIGLTGKAKELPDNRYLVCPDLGNGDVSSVTIALANQKDIVDVKALLGYPFYEGEFPIEQIINTNIQGFYDMISSGKPACFQTN